MNIAVGILTAPRKVSYIGQSLDSYFKIPGMPRPLVRCEPGSARFLNMSKCDVVENITQQGLVKNWNRLARDLLEMDKEWVMICEDDIEWQQPDYVAFSLGHVLSAYTYHPYHIISPYCSRMNADPERTDGWHTAILRPAYGLSGALAICMHRDTLCKFLDSKHNDTLDYRFHDFSLSEFAQANALEILTHQPSLIHHLGVESTLITKENNPGVYYHDCRKHYGTSRSPINENTV